MVKRQKRKKVNPIRGIVISQPSPKDQDTNLNKAIELNHRQQHKTKAGSLIDQHKQNPLGPCVERVVQPLEKNPTRLATQVGITWWYVKAIS